MLNIGVVGIGGCGNQIADLALKHNFEVLGINSSRMDVQLLDEKMDVVLIGEEGCGKNTSLAVKMVKAKSNTLVKRLQEKFNNKFDVIFVAAGGGGGTGAGSLAIVSQIIRESVKSTSGKKILTIPIEIFASKSESAQAKKNTIKTNSQIKALNYPYMVYSNDKSDATNIVDIYEKINNKIIMDLCIFRGDYNPASRYGNMDERDRLNIMSQPGMLTVGSITGIKLENLDNKEIDEYIFKSIIANYTPIQRDKVLKKMGVIISSTKDVIGKLDRKYPNIENELGKPTAIFDHLNLIEDGEDSSFITILSGLSNPDNVLKELEESINEEKDDLTKQTASKIQDINDSLSWMSDDEDDDIDEDDGQQDITDILKSY